MVLTLAPWGERERTQQQIVDDINRAARANAGDARQRHPAEQPGIRGAGNGLQMALVGNDYECADSAIGVKLVEADRSHRPLRNARLNNEPTQAQVSISIDRERASDLGIDITGLSAAIQAMLDGNAWSTSIVEGEAYPVKLSDLDTNPLNDPTDLENMFLKTGDGKIVPMSVIASLQESAVAPQLSRAAAGSVAITAGLKAGIALGDALTMVDRDGRAAACRRDRVLMPLAEAATLDENSNGMFVTFGFAIVIIFLVLAAQFESMLSAVIIMSTVPLGLACAVFAMLLTGNTSSTSTARSGWCFWSG
jgi:HAE1 family hydrophobic/amphiphilic exporter-1